MEKTNIVVLCAQKVLEKRVTYEITVYRISQQEDTRVKYVRGTSKEDMNS